MPASRPKPAHGLAYRSDIDGLRAIAVLSVLAFHAAPGKMPGGFVGVDIFFVISGFLISSILYRELESRTFSLVEFYVRRVRRIYPALFLVLVACCITGSLLLLPADFVDFGKQVLGGSSFAANFVLWAQSGYFSAEAALKPLLHLWSLGVEEQYYLFFPLLCWAFYRSRRRWLLPALFCLIGAASMIWNVAVVHRDPAAAYFLPFSRMWELLIGAGVALLMARSAGKPWGHSWKQNWMGGFGLLFLGFSILRIRESFPFPGWWALLPTLGSALVILAGPESWVNRRLLSARPVVYLGKISYPLYLWHWPLLSFLAIAVATWGFNPPSFTKYLLLLCAFPLAALTYHLVETPLRKVKDPGRRRRGAVWMFASVAMAGAFGLVVIVGRGLPARLPAAIVALDHRYGDEAALAWREGSCFLRRDQIASAFASDCVDSVSTSASGSASGFSSSARRLVLLWGDSHAADLYPGFRRMADRESSAGPLRLGYFSASLCAPLVGLELSLRPACRGVNDGVLQRVRELKPAVVVLSAYWDVEDPNHTKAARIAVLGKSIALIRAAGASRVVVIGPAPFWKSYVPGLLVAELHRHPGSAAPHRLDRKLLLPESDDLLRRTVEAAGGVYVPLVDQLCDASSCLVLEGPGWEQLMTYDQSHFTPYGSQQVAERIWPMIVASIAR